jgi:predicted oxidoreductase
MERLNLTENFSMSRIIHGQMRMKDWRMTNEQLLGMFKELINIGITTFDHADIYGNYECEAILGDVLSLDKSFRDKIEIVTKCGIKLVSDKYPDRKVKYYDYSYGHIIQSVNNSLKNLQTDHIDLLLLHRPAPFFDPEEAAKAFYDLKKAGKVLHFGVSNFTPAQFETLNSFTEEKLVTNQVEISPYCLEHFENGNMDFFMKEKIRPMAWSPVAGGRLLNPHDAKGPGIMRVLASVSEELSISPVDKVIYAWLLKHPVKMMPIAGTGKIDRIKFAADALSVDMTLEQWYKIFIAASGKELP